MTPTNGMRAPIRATLIGVVFLLVSSVIGQATGIRIAAAANLGSRPRNHHAISTPITLSVSVGYENIYRGTGWTPVRVTLHNRTNTDVQGTLEIPQSSQSSSVGASPAFHGLYQAPVTLSAGNTKHVTVYVPGSGVQGRVDVSLRQGTRILAGGTAYPIGIDSSALVIGAMAGSPESSAWIAPAIQQQVTTHVVHLTAATLDPIAPALATFDIIVLSNIDTSQLDQSQVAALHAYVRGGGSLLLVGGPAWQETLRPLQSTLLPGTLTGMRVVPNLNGLLSLAPMTHSSGAQSAVVSVLSRPSGTVLASQSGVPLVVRKVEGQGVIEYLAFDPSLSPIQGRYGASGLLQHLIAMAAPVAITRTWSPQGFRARFQTIFSSIALTQELANLPPTTWPLLALFAVLTVAYVLVLGPATFLILRWLGHQQIALISIPALAIVFLGSTFGLATHLRNSTSVLNTIGVIAFDDAATTHPATFYLGLTTPLSGDYHLTYGNTSLPAPLPQVNVSDGFFSRNASTLHSIPLGMTLQEDPQTTVTFLSMNRWSTREATLQTSIHLPGSVRSGLTLDASGNLTGAVHNGTTLDLLDPVIIAGQTIVHIPTISAGTTIHVHLHPTIDASVSNPQSLWARLYGGPDPSNFDGFGGFGFHDCCGQFSYAKETNLITRVQNAIAMLSQSQSLSTPGAITIVGWSERPLGSFSVGGTSPQRRDLNLIMAPLSVYLPAHGPFTLASGTIAAHLVDVLPRAPQSSCCGFGGPDSQQQLSVGSGGALTFEFDLPRGGHIRFQRLGVTVNDNASPGSGAVYNWRAHRWVAVNLSTGSALLSQPNRFVSSGGQVLIQLQATASSGDLTITDQYHAVDLSGAGVVS